VNSLVHNRLAKLKKEETGLHGSHEDDRFLFLSLDPEAQRSWSQSNAQQPAGIGRHGGKKRDAPANFKVQTSSSNHRR